MVTLRIEWFSFSHCNSFLLRLLRIQLCHSNFCNSWLMVDFFLLRGDDDVVGEDDENEEEDLLEV